MVESQTFTAPAKKRAFFYLTIRVQSLELIHLNQLYISHYLSNTFRVARFTTPMDIFFYRIMRTILMCLYNLIMMAKSPLDHHFWSILSASSSTWLTKTAFNTLIHSPLNKNFTLTKKMSFNYLCIFYKIQEQEKIVPRKTGSEQTSYVTSSTNFLWKELQSD